jgi:HlyD family secretion protein
MRTRILIIALVVGLVGGVIYVTQSQSEDPNRFTASGTIEASEVNVGSLAAGALIKLKVEEGDTVAKGDLLAQIDDKIAKSQVKQAQAAVDLADLRMESVPAAAGEYKSVEALARQAGAALDIAQAQLGLTTIKAPISGQVLTLPFTVGENLTQGGTIAVLADLDKLNVTVYVPEQHLGKVKLGQKAKISVDSFPDKTFSGRVTKIAAKPEFTPTNVETKEQRVKQVYAVTIKVTNRDGELKPGMPADVDLALK